MASIEAVAHALHHTLVGRASDANPKQESNSLSGLVSTLVPVLLLSTAFFVLFLILRRSQRRQYSPRSYLGTLRNEERSPELPSGLVSWFKVFFQIPDSYVLNHHSLDGFLFLRYLKICIAICFFGCLVTWPVLFPVNITGGGGLKQLDMLTFGNIEKTHKKRYYAHALVSCVFFAFILFMVTRECIYFINLRQAYLLSPLYSDRISSRTVLFTSVPAPYMDEAKLRHVFGPEVKNVWVCTDCKEIEELVKDRDKVAFRLEGAETKLVRLANAARLKSLKKGPVHRAEEGHDPTTTAAMTDESADGESGSLASRWLGQKDRPTHRLKPIIGKKVDTINWSRSELDRLIPRLEQLQASHRAGQGRFLNAVFVEFVSQTAAQDAYQALAHHQPLHMAPRYIGIRPEEVIWKNLRIKWWERVLRTIATTAFVVALIVLWAIPVTAVGAISNINALTDKVPFLKFITHIPPVILGVVTGLLPVVLLAVLIALVPIILRLVARIGGAPSLSQVELTVQHSFFGFQVVQVFLVTTISSAASAVVTKIIKQPSSTTSLLAANLPKASNFYINYFILQCLSISSSGLLQLVGLILAKVLGRILDSTPRKIYQRWSGLAGLGWGSVFPVFTNLVVIALVYSCIAPLLLGFATVGLWLIYMAFRYNLLFVFDVNIDTKGAVYPRALQQTLTGVYLAEICLIGLFGVRGAAGPIIIEVIALVATVLYHLSLRSAIGPMLKYLPKTMAAEEESLLAIENGHLEVRPSDHDEKMGSEFTGDIGGTATTGIRNGKTPDKAMRVLAEDANGAHGRLPSPVTKPSFLMKWLRPDKYCDYRTLRRLVPMAFADIAYTAEQERQAYHHPAIASPTPLLWIPRDQAGVSRQEVRHTAQAIPITDEGAYLDDKNRIITNQEENPPIHQEKIYY